MKKLFFIAIFLFTFVLTPSTTLAQSMMGTQSPVFSDNHTASEEQEGKEIWDKLQAKEIECKDLTNDNYAVLGEYFMGQSIGNTQRHAAMNQMMTSMMGEEGEERMHIAMGKRLSGCDTSAQIPANGVGFMPMMFLLRQGFGGQWMMGGWGGFGILGWVTMLAFWLILILGVIALIRYLGGSGKRSDEGKPALPAGRSPLDILKERYARGEIDKKEFEEMKKDLR